MPFLSYAANRAYFAEQCENTDKPELDCCGKCQVVKEVQKEGEQDNNPHTASGNDRTRGIEIFHIIPTETSSNLAREFSLMPLFLSSTTIIAEGFTKPPFQPPRA